MSFSQVKFRRCKVHYVPPASFLNLTLFPSTLRATVLQSDSGVHDLPSPATLRIQLTPTGIDSKFQIRSGLSSGTRISVVLRRQDGLRLFTVTATERDDGPHPHSHIVDGKGNGDDVIALRRRVIVILDLSLTIHEAPRR